MEMTSLFSGEPYAMCKEQALSLEICRCENIELCTYWKNVYFTTQIRDCFEWMLCLDYFNKFERIFVKNSSISSSGIRDELRVINDVSCDVRDKIKE
jgi:hypothetical protein